MYPTWLCLFYCFLKEMTVCILELHLDSYRNVNFLSRNSKFYNKRTCKTLKLIQIAILN